MNLTIENHVHFLNEIHRLKRLIIESVPEQIKPFIGAKVTKVNFSLLDKVKSAIILPEFEPVPLKGGLVSVQYYYLSADEYSLKIGISLCFSGGSYDDKTYYCHYEQSTFYLCDIKNHLIDKFCNWGKYPEINADETVKKISEYKFFIGQAERIKNSIQISPSLYAR